MVEQSGLRVTHMTLHPDKLIGDVIKFFSVVRQSSILSCKSFAHVQTIEPHLIRVTQLVPVAAFLRAWMPNKLLVKKISRLLIFFLFRLRVKPKYNAPRSDVIDVVLRQF